jgi:N-terminal domain of NWD NACHT-NTPase
LQALSEIGSIISQCTMRETLYHKRYESTNDEVSAAKFQDLHLKYRDILKRVYVDILRFQVTSICFLSKHTVTLVMKELFKWHDWESMLANIRSRETVLKSFEQQWRDMKLDEEWEKMEGRHRQRMNGLRLIENEITRLREIIKVEQTSTYRRDLLNWLSSVDPSSNYNHARGNHALSTGDWLVDKNFDFKLWANAPNSQLWLSGKGTAYISI